MHEHLNSKNRRSNVATRGCRILKTLIRHIKSTFLVHTIQILLDYFLFDLRWIKNVAFVYILFCSLKMNSWKTKTQLYMRPDFDFLYSSFQRGLEWTSKAGDTQNCPQVTGTSHTHAWRWPKLPRDTQKWV